MNTIFKPYEETKAVNCLCFGLFKIRCAKEGFSQRRKLKNSNGDYVDEAK